ncbi:MAG: hypothetical protein OXU36_03485 [Candidatus Poribacteria bacterium]|nr:hypothetical protein [Candidatus Poribacteria bacterium]
MIKIIQAVRNTIESIPFDELENEEDEFKKVQIVGEFDSVMATPDPLDEEDELKLKELLQAEAPFEKIRNFIEYLRCKDQNILFVVPDGGNHKGKEPEYIRGRRFIFVEPWEAEAQGRQPNTSALGKIDKHISDDLKKPHPLS